MSKKSGKRLEETFHSRRHMNGQLAHAKVLTVVTSLVTGKCKKKRKKKKHNTMRFHLIPTRMAKIKKADNAKCWRGYGPTGTITYC